MSEQITVRFTVNGREVEVTASRDAPLIYILRNDLGLTGSRLGCGQGFCGACTITVDGHVQTCCDTPLWAVEGKAIGTVEALAEGPTQHPLAQALIDHQAGQCGYCLPGILVRAAALIDAGHDMDHIRTEMDANLCRCGAHGRILDAIADTIAGREAAA